MKSLKGNTIFAVIEMAIGAITFFTVIGSIIEGVSTKPAQVVVFVLTTAAISFCLGIGLLRYHIHSLHLLVFLSAFIVLSKVLIFAKIISLHGALETNIPQPIKDIFSIVYHGILIWYYSIPSVRGCFGEEKNAIFSLRIPFTK